MSQTAIVVGGGIVGLSVALALQDEGFAVRLLDAPGRPRAASWGNAGRIATELVAPLASPASLRRLPRDLFAFGGAAAFPLTAMRHWLPFGLRLLAAATPRRFAAGQAALADLMADALPAWRRLVAATGSPGLLVEAGHYSVWESARAAEAGIAAWQDADTGPAHFRAASASELRRIQAGFIRPLAAALRFEGSAQVADLAALEAALTALFAARGGVREEDAATLAAVAARGADAIVVAAGIGSAALMRAAGHRVPMIAERGYHIEAPHIEAPRARWDPALPSLFFEERSLVVTGFAGGLRATSFVEFSSADAPPDRAKWARLTRDARDLGLPFGDAPRRWMGVRPTFPDYLPAIGRSPAMSNLYYAFGHQHLGLTLAPVTGERVAALVAGRSDVRDLAPFDLARFERSRFDRAAFGSPRFERARFDHPRFERARFGGGGRS